MKNWGAMALIAFSLTACGDSGLNPLGWFSSQEEDVETLSELTAATFQDPRPLVPSVTSLRIERTPGGAIVRATGLPSQQGWHDAAIVPRNDGRPVDGVLTFDFRASPPEEPTRGSTVQSRELVVAYPLGNVRLQSVRTIRVVGATNAMTTRR